MCFLLLWSLYILSPQPPATLFPGYMLDSLNSGTGIRTIKLQEAALLSLGHSLFEFLSICTTIFKEAQRVHEITRSSHLGLEVEKNSVLKFCHYTHLICLFYQQNKQAVTWPPTWLLLWKQSLGHFQVNSLFYLWPSLCPGWNPNHFLAAHSLWL